MSTATVDSSSKNLPAESISLVDLRLLSQSELHTLALCSDKAFDLGRCDDVVIPKIDRSVFNESAGSRKQTYSRLRLAPRKPEISTIGPRRRCPGLLPIPKPPTNAIDDPERKENKRIVSILKEFFARENIPIEGGHGGESFPEPVNVNNAGADMRRIPMVAVDGERKRKRGRKPKNIVKPNVEADGGDLSKAMVVYDSRSNLEDRSMEIVNKNGVIVDVAALANVEDPFGAELKRRTVGFETEPQLLEFLRGLNGHWGSRRKKRKIVDASDFGDVLPRGWKLLLSLKRKEGRVSLYCRRYISPNGQQFVSWKDVSLYLLSFLELQDDSQLNSGHGVQNIQQASNLCLGMNAGLTNYKDDGRSEDLMCYSALPITSVPSDHKNHMDVLAIENLAEVQIHDLLVCQKCNMTFDEKDAYLQHLLSSHQRTPKRLRLGTSICDGVIIRDGKFECQFCHKIFDERHRYNGHVGVHVRNFVRSNEALSSEMSSQRNVEPSSLSGVPPRVSKMDGPADIVEVTTPVTSMKPINAERGSESSHCNVEAHASPEIPSVKSNWEQNLGPHCKVATADSNKISTQVNSSKPTHESDSGSPHCEMDLVFSSGILHPAISSKNDYNKSNAGYSQSDIETSSNPEIPFVKPYHEQNFDSPTEVDAVGNHKGLIAANSSKQNSQSDAGSPHYKMDLGPGPGIFISETSAKPNNEELDAESPQSKIDTRDSSEIPSMKSNNGQNVCPDIKIDAIDIDVGSIQVNSSEPNNETDAESLHFKVETVARPEIIIAKSDDGVDVSAPCAEENSVASKINEAIVDGSDDQNFMKYKMTDEKLEKISEASKSTNVEPGLCCNLEIPVTENSKVAHSDTYDGKNVNAVSIDDADESEIKQGRYHGNCSIFPSENKQTFGLEENRVEGFICSTEDCMLDIAEKTRNPELKFDFGINCAGPNLNVLAESAEVSDEEIMHHSEISLFSSPEDSKFWKAEKMRNNDLRIDLGSNHVRADSGIGETEQRTDAINILQSGIAESSLPLVQSLACFPIINEISEKGEDELCRISQKLDNVSGFEELKLDDMEAPKFDFVTAQGSNSLSMELAYGTEMDQRLDPSIPFEWKSVSPKMAAGTQLSTLCVWCRMEFNLDAVNSEAQPVGFACPTCKASISGQLNVLDNDLPMNPHQH